VLKDTTDEHFFQNQNSMNNKTLFIVLLALLGVYGLSKLFSGKKERSFKAELIQVDTSKVTAVSIFPKPDSIEVSLKREGDAWIVSRGTISTRAMPNVVGGLLNQLARIKTKRVAAKKPEKWAEYEVEEGNGTRLVVYAGNKVLEDFILGRFSFDQTAQTATSFVRLTGENEVYAVDGFLALNLGQGFDSYRNKELVKIQKEDITSLDFTEGNATYSINKLANGWALNGTELLDSTKIKNYIGILQAISGVEFADDFDVVQSADLLQKTLTINANNQIEPLVIQCYADTTREKPFILNSSFNPDAWFASDSSGIYQRFFKPVEELRVSE
jgi:Domain of unknown function (DUF4340)